MSDTTLTPAPLAHSTINWPLFLRRFLPLFVIAAIMPVVLQTAFTFSSAERSNELRVWIEPDTIVARENSPVELSVMAQFDDEARLLSTVSVNLESKGAVMEPQQLHYSLPFRGTVKLGTVRVSAPQSGTYTISIPNEGVTLSRPEGVTIITTPATMLVKTP